MSRDWTLPNIVRITRQADRNSDAVRDHSWRLTGALRWNCGVLEQEWCSHHGVTEWQPVPTVLPGDTV